MIATKVRFPMGSKPNQSGLGRKHMIESVEASLKRLRTDYVDLLYAHAWDYNTPLEETLETFSVLVRDARNPLRCVPPSIVLMLFANEWMFSE